MKAVLLLLACVVSVLATYAPPRSYGVIRHVCRYNGKIYKVGQSFPAKDGCNTCTCSTNGRIRCTLKACVKVCKYNNKVYKVGRRFRAKDGCNKCRCRPGGRVTCSKRKCIKVCRYNGKVYKIGHKFRAKDRCNTCRCRSGGRVTCTKKRCVKVCRYNKKVYKVGQTFPATDGCNKCRCRSGGRVSCSRRKCVKYPAKGKYVCAQPKVVGPCKARIPRWYYSKKAKCCVKFYYGGCKGNGNNFKTRAACHRRCKNLSCKCCIDDVFAQKNTSQ